ncbi:MAG: hypothetical protein IJ002_01160 [Clostridia bacterium]|nr:hypothetical protein [Clostridia bacterium]
MKKIISVLLAAMLVFAFAACGETENVADTTVETTEEVVDTTAADTTEAVVDTTAVETTADEAVEAPAVMSYAEYAAAELDTAVTVEAYVQGHQSWWDNKITVYAQDADGAYFIYEMACSEEDAAKLVAGTRILVSGYKAEWAGEVEIVDATFEFVTDGESFVAEAMDATALLGTEDLIAHQNKLVAFKGMTVEAVEFKNGEAGDDIYVTLSKDGASYNFCVEVYLTGTDTEVYTTVSALTAGTVVDVEGFLYWYEGMNPHITAITVAQ